MASQEDKQTLGELLKWEQANLFSREKVTILDGEVVAIGSVLGKITASGKYALYKNAAADGTQAAAAVAVEAVSPDGADGEAVVLVRDAILSDAALVWEGTQDAAAKTAGIADLKALGILVRTGV